MAGSPTARLALVTGSSRGLGASFAEGLASSGARVLLHGRDQVALTAQAALELFPIDLSRNGPLHTEKREVPRSAYKRFGDEIRSASKA